MLLPSTASHRASSPSTSFLTTVQKSQSATVTAVREEQDPYHTHFDEETKCVALKVESEVDCHKTMVVESAACFNTQSGADGADRTGLRHQLG